MNDVDALWEYIASLDDAEDFEGNLFTKVFTSVDIKRFGSHLIGPEDHIPLPFVVPSQSIGQAFISNYPRPQQRDIHGFYDTVKNRRKSHKYADKALLIYEQQPSKSLGYLLARYYLLWKLPEASLFFDVHAEHFPGDYRLKFLKGLQIANEDSLLNPQCNTLLTYQQFLGNVPSFVSLLPDDELAEGVYEAYFVQAVWDLLLNHHLSRALYCINVCHRIQEAFPTLVSTELDNRELESLSAFWFQRIRALDEVPEQYLPIVNAYAEKGTTFFED